MVLLVGVRALAPELLVRVLVLLHKVCVNSRAAHRCLLRHARQTRTVLRRVEPCVVTRFRVVSVRPRERVLHVVLRERLPEANGNAFLIAALVHLHKSDRVIRKEPMRKIQVVCVVDSAKQPAKRPHEEHNQQEVLQTIAKRHPRADQRVLHRAIAPAAQGIKRRVLRSHQDPGVKRPIQMLLLVIAGAEHLKPLERREENA